MKVKVVAKPQPQTEVSTNDSKEKVSFSVKKFIFPAIVIILVLLIIFLPSAGPNTVTVAGHEVSFDGAEKTAAEMEKEFEEMKAANEEAFEAKANENERNFIDAVSSMSGVDIPDEYAVSPHKAIVYVTQNAGKESRLNIAVKQWNADLAMLSNRIASAKYYGNDTALAQYENTAQKYKNALQMDIDTYDGDERLVECMNFLDAIIQEFSA